MKWLMVLGILVLSNLVAAGVVLAVGTVWIELSEDARNNVLPGTIIGLFAIAASLAVPYGLLRWRGNG
jgi:hypothetical protein